MIRSATHPRLRAIGLAAIVAALSACAAPPAPPAAPVRPITLSVDATDVARRVFHATLVVPASPGPLTLVYPEWIPGEHGPTGPITDLVGVHMRASGKPLAWRRDDVNMYAFHVEVPAGADAVEVSLDFLSARSTDGFSSAASVTPHLAIVTWNQLLLSPGGAKTDDVMIQASLRLPAGWQSATSLPIESRTENEQRFKPVSLTTLVDSPVLAGEHFKVVPLAGSPRPVELDIAADSDKALAIHDDQIHAMTRLVAEADALFGARHFDTYHFLLTLSDEVAHFGLEHHQSNDTRLAEHALLDHSQSLWVLAHEFTHSWNGKYRRPVGLATPDFEQPMRGELLWVYEGLTEYIGVLLSARSGIWTPQQYRDNLSAWAAYFDHEPGREWRPLIDTTVAAQLLYNAPAEWSSFRRGVDFYDEGWLVWLDADTLIREKSNGQRSLDDFCRRFHGGESGSPALRPYTMDEVLQTLNDVQPNDWKAFFTERLMQVSAHAPLDGLARGGWQLAYDDTRNDFLKFRELNEPNVAEYGYSIGLRVGKDGNLVDVIPGTAGYAAGLGPGMKLTAVNGKPWSADALRQAILSSSHAGGPIKLTIENSKDTKTVAIEYRGGLREPHLSRAAGKPDLLEAILAPRAPAGK